MSLLNRVEDLLDLSQKASILLQEKTANTKDSQLRAILSSAGKDLRSGIKDLVKIQDKLDEATKDADRASWESKANETLERTRGYLHFATKVTADGFTANSDITPYRPLPPVARTSLATMLHPLQDPLSTPMSDTTNMKSSNGSQHTVQDADATNEEEETFVDAVENIATPPEAQTTTLESKLKSLSMDPSVPLRRSNSNFSLFSLPPNATWEPTSREPENPLSLSLTIEDYFPVPSQSTSKIPTLSSTSTPLPVSSNNSINIFNDDNEETVRRSSVFASDVEVSHPLRIGVGYGSYVCYSCTIFSSKGASISARKRYSDFVQLRESLIEHFPRLKSNIPKLPPKKVVEKRRRELEYFLKYVSLHPTLGSSMVLKRWLTQ
ncbi:hypothetical protein INT43_008487 [Umbelopsis isabellina]|uniref:PX domain-containing protein n=1 Tax=Mortierella isabellina TaxID=91625 RepID=A0A8H7UGL0_MORIS|nr:hypothetical protein INT43_008487 [Umbelopsis isabellina]